MSNRKKPTDNKHFLLIGQINAICPICDKKLIYEKKSQKFKGYEVAHIYPLNPRKDELVTLKDVEILGNGDIDHEDNLIPLCETCHTKFDRPRTKEEYLELLGTKKKLIQEERARDIWNEATLSEDINHIVSEMENLSEIPIESLDYNVLKVDEKFDSSILNLTQRKITLNVVSYYPFIRDQLIINEKRVPGATDIICAEVVIMSCKLKQVNSNKQYIYEELVKWFQRKTKTSSIESAEILASYFIQNCEALK